VPVSKPFLYIFIYSYIFLYILGNYMNKGDIWLINLDPSVGAEIHKSRPAVIVSSDAVGILPLKIIIPVTDWKSHYKDVPWIVKLLPDDTNNLSKISGADAFQVRSVSRERFVKKIGKTDKDTIDFIGNKKKVLAKSAEGAKFL
jgi:mRNA interferase MazF